MQWELCRACGSRKFVDHRSKEQFVCSDCVGRLLDPGLIIEGTNEPFEIAYTLVETIEQARGNANRERATADLYFRAVELGVAGQFEGRGLCLDLCIILSRYAPSGHYVGLDSNDNYGVWESLEGSD